MNINFINILIKIMHSIQQPPMTMDKYIKYPETLHHTIHYTTPNYNHIIILLTVTAINITNC